MLASNSIDVLQCQDPTCIPVARREQPACDFLAMKKKFKAGQYSSVVSYNVTTANLIPVLFLLSPLHIFNADGFRFVLKKSFHEDVASVMRQWLKEEELLPDHHKVTTQAKTYYIKVSRCPNRTLF